MSYKPRHRKRSHVSWGKVAAVAVAVLIAGGAAWYLYGTYIYKPPPEYAVISTSLGSFEVELFPACAPQTVSNFVSLAENGFYNGLAWHRIVKGFVIQTGDPVTRGGLNSTRTKWGQGGSNATVPLEVGRCPLLGNYQGYVGMARKGNQTVGLDTGTSQFYINLSNSTSNLSLNGEYTVFGKVISGMDVVLAIGSVKVCAPPICPIGWPPSEPLKPVFVNSISIQKTP